MRFFKDIIFKSMNSLQRDLRNFFINMQYARLHVYNPYKKVSSISKRNEGGSYPQLSFSSYENASQ